MIVMINGMLTSSASTQLDSPSIRSTKRRIRIGDSFKPLRRKSNEGDGREIMDSKAVVSCCDALPVFESTKHALDDVAASVSGSIEWVGYVTICPPGNDGLDPSLDEPKPQSIGIVGLVGDQATGR